MTAYLDASVLMSAFHRDSHTERVFAWLEATDDFIFSGWTLAEVSSALALRQRLGEITAQARGQVETHLDLWAAGRPQCDVGDEDCDLARLLIRSDPNLRAPDALHLAIAVRHGLEIATLDKAQAEAARRLELSVVEL